jgi:hypothetical protein
MRVENINKTLFPIFLRNEIDQGRREKHANIDDDDDDDNDDDDNKPVIRGATETISKSFRQYLSNIPEKHEIKELQKQRYCARHKYFGKY